MLPYPKALIVWNGRGGMHRAEIMVPELKSVLRTQGFPAPDFLIAWFSELQHHPVGLADGQVLFFVFFISHQGWR